MYPSCEGLFPLLHSDIKDLNALHREGCLGGGVAMDRGEVELESLNLGQLPRPFQGM